MEERRLNMRRLVAVAVVGTAAALASTSSAAADPPNWRHFQTPSKNIQCGAFRDGSGTWHLECRMFEPAWVYSLSARGRPKRQRPCDPGAAAPYPKLAYGMVWRRGPFRCKSRAVGLRCWSSLTGKGFLLSKEDQRFITGSCG